MYLPILLLLTSFFLLMLMNKFLNDEELIIQYGFLLSIFIIVPHRWVYHWSRMCSTFPKQPNLK